MKRLFFLLFAAAATALAACDEDKDYGVPNETYVGTLTVTSASDSSQSYTYTDKQFRIVNPEDGTMTLWMIETQFVPAMPELTMEVPGIDYSRQMGGITLLSGDQITPYMGGTPYERYLITELSGEVIDGTPHRLVVEFDCMGFHVAYEGAQAE